MKVFELLNYELNSDPNGKYAPYYYRYLGYKEDLTASPSIFRANGIYSLFSRSKPVILKNELIIGNTKSLFCEEDTFVLEYAKNIVNSASRRYFLSSAVMSLKARQYALT